MKTFNDLKVGDYFYVLDLDKMTLYRNEIIDIDGLGENKAFIWIDNNNNKGTTLIPFTKRNASVYEDIFLTTCVTVKDVIDILCNS